MAITRRKFVEAGIAGMAAVAGGQRGSRAQALDDDLRFTVVGVDGSDLTGAYVNEYQHSHADVWQYSDNVVDFEKFDVIDKFLDTHSSQIMLAKSYSDILAAKRAGKLAMVVGCQECSPLEPEWRDSRGSSPNNWILNPPITKLSDYRDRGLLIANLAYNLSNFFGGGCLDPTTPLSRAGVYIIRQMQEIGILVDCSHSSERTTLDIIGMARRPVVCSHSNSTTLDDNPRNVSDSVIKGIADTGGLIGVCPVNALLLWSREDAPYAEAGPFPPLASISQYVDVMDYIRNLVGIDHIGIGSDFTISKTPFTSPPPSQSFTYPPEMGYNQPHGLDYVKHFRRVGNLPVLREELLRHGYSPVDIAKVLGGNWMRVFREAWNA